MSDIALPPLVLVPIDLDEANAFIALHHRHHDPARGCKFVAGVARAREVVGVAVVGRPNARMAADTWTAEVTRVCYADPIDKAANGGHASGACSMLYAACWRAAKALGYRKTITYSLPEEGGASLRAAGWICLGEAGGGSWHREARPRVDTHPTQVKLRWERT